jgi:hypothetical protein
MPSWFVVPGFPLPTDELGIFMKNLTGNRRKKLQTILSKRLGRELSEEELDEAYASLMNFASALYALTPSSIYQVNNSKHLQNT